MAKCGELVVIDAYLFNVNMYIAYLIHVNSVLDIDRKNVLTYDVSITIIFISKCVYGFQIVS